MGNSVDGGGWDQFKAQIKASSSNDNEDIISDFNFHGHLSCFFSFCNSCLTTWLRPSCKGASIYEVRSGWWEGGPQKADERNKISWFVTVTRGGGKKILRFCGTHIWKPPQRWFRLNGERIWDMGYGSVIAGDDGVIFFMGVASSRNRAVQLTGSFHIWCPQKLQIDGEIVFFSVSSMGNNSQWWLNNSLTVTITSHLTDATFPT